VQPFTQDERLMHVKQAQSRLGSSFTWLCDTMDNVAKHRLGDAPNSEFVIDSRGRIVRSRSWSDPDQLRKDLTELVGPVRKPTKAADLRMPRITPDRDVARGVVPRITKPGGMQAVMVEADVETSKAPFYAKLRAEADSNLLRSGNGQLYLGFLIDPLYHVHWNNLSEPLHVEIRSDDDARIDPSVLEGPKVQVESDSDPREFLVTIENARHDTELHLEVFYFACDDDQTWCKAIRQTYTVKLEVDRDAGWVRGHRGGERGRRRDAGSSGGRDSSMSMGTVANVNTRTGTITIRMRGGESQKYRVTDHSTIMRDRRRSSLRETRRGDRIRFESEDSRGKGDPEIVRMMIRSSR
jgi:hypothetical protein